MAETMINIQIGNGKIEWPEGLETFRPLFFQSCDLSEWWRG